MSKFTIKISATLNGKACKNPQVEFIQGAGCIYPCEIKDNEITIETLPGSNDCNCIEGYIKCEDECLNCPPQHFKRCFCDTSEDCQDCETCVDGLCIADCPDKLCINDTCCDCAVTEDCPKGFVCNGCGCNCIGTINSDGECVQCKTKGDCKACENCIDGKCVPLECPNNLVCVNGGCGCPAGTKYDPVTNSCIPIVCNDDAECGSCESCLSNQCVPINCPAGTKAVIANGVCTCVEWPCVDVTCENGADCGKGCGCLNGECVPCKYLDCGSLETCEQSLGCECNDLQKCQGVGGCNEEYCDDFVQCGTPGCTCYENKCVSCENFSCDDGECAEQKGCTCKNDKCQGIGCNNEPCTTNANCGVGCTCQDGQCKDTPCSGSCVDSNGCAGENCICVDGKCEHNPNGGGCKNQFVLNKNCGETADSCYLEAVLTADDCACADIKTQIRLSTFNSQTNELVFDGDLFKGTANFKNYKTDSRFSDEEVLAGSIAYDVVDVKTGVILETKTIPLPNTGANVNKVPQIKVNIAAYRNTNCNNAACTTNANCAAGCACQGGQCKPVDREIAVVFRNSGFSTTNNDCTKYDSETLGSFNFKLNGGTSVDINKPAVEGFVKDKDSAKKPLFIWYKNGAAIRKINPTKSGNTYTDRLPENDTELLYNYEVVTDCNGCANNKVSESNLKFCCLGGEVTITNCATKLDSPPIKLCNVNKNHSNPVLEINGVQYDWSSTVTYNNPQQPITSVVGYLRVDADKICTKAFDVPNEKIEINVSGKCKIGNAGEIVLTAPGGAKIASVTGTPPNSTITGIGTSTVTITISNAKDYSNYINQSTVPSIVLKSDTGCEVKIAPPKLEGECGVTLNLAKVDITEACVGAATGGSITATLDGIGDLTGFAFSLNGANTQNGKTATWTGLVKGTYTVRVVGHGIDESKDIAINKAVTKIDYTVTKVSACGGNNGSVTISLPNVAELTGNVTISVGGVSRILSSTSPTATWSGLASNSYTITVAALTGFVFCGPTSVDVSSETTTLRVKIDPISACSGQQGIGVVLKDENNNIYNTSDFDVTVTNGSFANGVINLNTGAISSTVKFCHKNPCVLLAIVSGNTSMTLSANCLTHTLTVSPLPIVGAATKACVGTGVKSNQITIPVSPALTTHTVQLVEGITVKGTFTKDGVTANYNLTTPLIGNFEIVATNPTTGCTVKTPVQLTDCNVIQCPTPITLSPQTICTGEGVRLQITPTQFGLAGYTGEGNVSVVVNNGFANIFSKLAHDPTQLFDEFIPGPFTSSIVLQVLIQKFNCASVTSILQLTVNEIGTGGCVCDEVCPELGEGDVCSLYELCGVLTECNCGPGLACVSNICVPIALDCGCGSSNIDGTACNCDNGGVPCTEGGFPPLTCTSNGAGSCVCI
jgi:hypothetical protein